MDRFHVAYPGFLRANGYWATIGLFMKHMKNVRGYKRSRAKALTEVQTLSSNKPEEDTLVEPIQSGSSTNTARKPAVEASPHTPSRQQKKPYPSPQSQKQTQRRQAAKGKSRAKSKSPASSSNSQAFESIDIVTTTDKRGQTAGTPQATIKAVRFTNSNKYTEAIEEYFGARVGWEAEPACFAFLWKLARLAQHTVEQVDFQEKLNEEWHRSVGFPPFWSTNTKGNVLLEWWTLYELLIQYNKGDITLHRVAQSSIEERLNIDRM